MRELRRHGTQIFQAGVDAVRGDRLVRDHVWLDEDRLWVGQVGVERSKFDRIVVVGAGKASGAMAVGLMQALSMEPQLRESPSRTPLSDPDPGDLPLGKMIVGQVNVPEGAESIPEGLWWPPELTLLPARPAAVNEPTIEAIAGTDRILNWIRSAGARDLILVLISGGGSALLCQPVAGVTLNEKLAVIRHLSSSGADITQLNTVRKHLSEVKGGGLARASGDANMITLILSDVLGDPLDLIASGPTVLDRSTPTDALAVLDQFDPDRQLPVAVYQAITRARQSQVAAVSQREFPVVVLGNNAVAVGASGTQAASLGYIPKTHSASCSEGLAEQVGEELARNTLALLRATSAQPRCDALINNALINDALINDALINDALINDALINDALINDALITGGEPVVQLADASIRGRGGRNQQLVLSAYRWLRQRDLSDDVWQRLLILSGGTDGEDGPTDAAGALIDGDVHDRAIELGLAPDDFLRRNDAYEFFRQTGGLLITGPTGTNVCDLRVALVDRSHKKSHVRPIMDQRGLADG